jgi:TolA-binding protein
MKKSMILILTLALCSAVAVAQEQEKKSSGIAEWLRGLQKKISQIVPKQDLPVSTGVAGVRGAKEDSAAKVYWKGKKGEDAVTEDEMAKFKAAIELASAGDREGALKQLDEFMKQNPDSALIPDARKTYDLVKAEPAKEEKTGAFWEERAAPAGEKKAELKEEAKPAEKQEGPKAEVKEEKKEEQMEKQK